MTFTGREYIVIRMWLLHDKPHAFDIFLCITPIALCIEVSKIKDFLESQFISAGGKCDLPCYK